MKSAFPYVQRLLEDEFIQEQLREAAGGLRAVYMRARSKRGQAAEDKRLYRDLRQAATSIRDAMSGLQRPKPQPKRRARKLATIALAIGGCAWLTIKLQKLQSQDASSSGAPSAQSDTSATEGADGSPNIPQPEHAEP